VRSGRDQERDKQQDDRDRPLHAACNAGGTQAGASPGSETGPRRPAEGAATAASA
jgi:hypothetical protein